MSKYKTVEEMKIIGERQLYYTIFLIRMDYPFDTPRKEVVRSIKLGLREVYVL